MDQIDSKTTSSSEILAEVELLQKFMLDRLSITKNENCMKLYGEINNIVTTALLKEIVKNEDDRHCLLKTAKFIYPNS